MGKVPVHFAVLIAATVVVATNAFSYMQIEHASNITLAPLTVSAPPPATTVGALARLQPDGDIINVSAGSSAGSAKISKLLVKEGQYVRKGQRIACLSTQDVEDAAAKAAAADVALRRARLSQLYALPKAEELAAQDRLVERLSAECARAKSDADRYANLFREGAVSAMDNDQYNTRAVVAERELQRARAQRAAMTEVRSADAEVLRNELAVAEARLAQANAQAENTWVCAPIDGQVLRVYTRAGEQEDAAGIVEIGAVQRMFARAEVFESDLKSIHPGQRATISGDAFAGTLSGTVERIQPELSHQSIMSSDPAAEVDRRVALVYVLLDDASARRCRSLSNAVCEVRFQ